jgi:hypothetical protein
LIVAVRESAFLAQSGHGDREDGSLLSGGMCCKTLVETIVDP